MPKLLFDQIGERFYETGVRNTALFPFKNKAYQTGVAWNGVTAFNVSPEGAESNPLYADDMKYVNLISAENINASIETYTYPDEFEECLGFVSPIKGMKIAQQARIPFGLVTRTTIGNDVNADLGFKLHLLYNAIAAPSERAYASINDSPEAITFSYEISTTPVEVGTINGVEYKPTSYIELDSTDFIGEDGKLDANFQALVDMIYGTDDAEPTLPTPAQVYNLLSTGSVDGAGA